MRVSNLTVGIYTLGCKVNQYESEAIAEQFESAGFCVLHPSEHCDIYVINTCTVTAESDRKARQFIRRAIKQNPNAYVLVTGCMSQTQPEAAARIAGVDYVCGNAEKLSVVDAARKLVSSGKKAEAPTVCVPAPDAYGFEPMTIKKFDRTRAYVKIEDGCESRCTYCTIPNARGSIRSKSREDVLREVRGLVAGGCREIVLTGIETGSYGKDLDSYRLPDLLEEIDAIPGIGRVRLGSLDPSIIKPEFVSRIARLRSLAPHFHLSMQSGSDRVLALMKRKYNTRMALEGMERLRAAMPDVQFTTDMIVGFPQESDEDFETTMEFVRRAKFLMIHVFPYSKRAGTPAATMKGQIPDQIKHTRAARLSSLQSEIRREILDTFTGKQVSVLFETFENGNASGHTPEFVEVVCRGSNFPHAKSLSVTVTGNDGEHCFGELDLPCQQ